VPQSDPKKKNEECGFSRVPRPNVASAYSAVCPIHRALCDGWDTTLSVLTRSCFCFSGVSKRFHAPKTTPRFFVFPEGAGAFRRLKTSPSTFGLQARVFFQLINTISCARTGKVRPSGRTNTTPTTHHRGCLAPPRHALQILTPN
jgi:hypothetical protein